MVVLILFALLSSCSRRKEPLKIGLVTTLTGRHSTVGIHSRAGFLLAMEEQNTAGGIQGRTIELIIADDAGNTDTAVRINEQLIHDEDVAFFFGHSTSMFYPAIEKILSRHDVLFFSPTLSTNRLSGKDDLFLRCMPSTQEQALTILKLIEYEQYSRLSVVYDKTNKGYSDDIVEILMKSSAVYGIEILNIVSFSDKPDYSGIIEQALSPENDSLLIISSGYDAGYLAQYARMHYPSINLVGSEWAKSGEIITHGGQAVEEMLFASAKEVEEGLPEYLEYRDKYYNTFNHMPEMVSLKAYEGAKILFEGMEQAEQISPEGVKMSILAIGKFKSLRGTIYIDEYGDASSPMGVYTLKNGEFQFLYLLE